MAEEKYIVLVGSGGCMREIVWQIVEHNEKILDRKQQTCQEIVWHIDGYVDVNEPAEGGGCSVGSRLIPYLGTDEWLLQIDRPVYAVICVGNIFLRKKIVENLKQNPNIQFPNLILGDARICMDVEMGEGCIVSMDCRISTNVKLGNFVFMNIGSKICHDGRIRDFVTLSPDVTLAGNVSIGNLCEIGLGAKIIQGISIGEKTRVGAGSVVIRDVEEQCTVVGIPARKMA